MLIIFTRKTIHDTLCVGLDGLLQYKIILHDVFLPLLQRTFGETSTREMLFIPFFSVSISSNNVQHTLHKWGYMSVIDN